MKRSTRCASGLTSRNGRRAQRRSIPSGRSGFAWAERVNAILADRRKTRVAALLYWILDEHIGHCLHRRQCPEKSLMEEATIYLSHVAKEEATWGDGTVE